MEKLLYPQHPFRCIITRPSECGKNYSSTNLILGNFDQFKKIYTSNHQVYIKIYIKEELNVLLIT